uniref:DNA topoisomerase (ATP-hydrolyzing) n=1 Tax=Caenorhabditis japonica TaxID=281687 RepID=A0A8R1HMC4_CAEJA
MLCPIIPLLLVNGSEGIGTGWSTKIANRSANDVIDLMRRKIDNMDSESIAPFYEDFDGKIEVCPATKFTSVGKIQTHRPERKNAATFSLEIQELPVGIWTSKYKEKLTKILETLPVVDFSEHHTEKRVNFRLTFDRKSGLKLLKKSNLELLTMFKLRNSFTENPTLFDANGRLRVYENVVDIAAEFFKVRRSLYEQRLETQKEECEKKLRYVENQVAWAHDM